MRSPSSWTQEENGREGGWLHRNDLGNMSPKAYTEDTEDASHTLYRRCRQRKLWSHAAREKECARNVSVAAQRKRIDVKEYLILGR